MSHVESSAEFLYSKQVVRLLKIGQLILDIDPLAKETEKNIESIPFEDP